MSVIKLDCNPDQTYAGRVIQAIQKIYDIELNIIINSTEHSEAASEFAQTVTAVTAALGSVRGSCCFSLWQFSL